MLLNPVNILIMVLALLISHIHDPENKVPLEILNGNAIKPRSERKMTMGNCRDGCSHHLKPSFLYSTRIFYSLTLHSL
jgi:hypothetical protein